MFKKLHHLTVMQPLKEGKDNTKNLNQRQCLVSYYYINTISVYCPALVQHKLRQTPTHSVQTESTGIQVTSTQTTSTLCAKLQTSISSHVHYPNISNLIYVSREPFGNLPLNWRKKWVTWLDPTTTTTPLIIFFCWHPPSFRKTKYSHRHDS